MKMNHQASANMMSSSGSGNMSNSSSGSNSLANSTNGSSNIFAQHKPFSSNPSLNRKKEFIFDVSFCLFVCLFDLFSLHYVSLHCVAHSVGQARPTGNHASARGIDWRAVPSWFVDFQLLNFIVLIVFDAWQGEPGQPEQLSHPIQFAVWQREAREVAGRHLQTL
jgi:hypothetical protein